MSHSGDDIGYSILFFNHVGEFSGAERQMLTWISRLAHAGHRLLLACPDSGCLPQIARREGVSCLSVASGVILRSIHLSNLTRILYYQVIGTVQLIKHILHYKIDIVHANSFTAGLNAVVATNLTRRPLVWHMQDILTPRRINRLAVRWLAHNVSAIICPSVAVRDNLVKLGIPSGLCKVVYTTIETSNKDEDQNDRICLKVELGLPKSSLLVGMIGQIAAWKGQDVLLRAIAKIYQEIPFAYLVLIGDVLFDASLSYRDDLHTYASDVGLGERVFFTGFRDDAASLMSELDVLVHASIRPDPLPTVLLEALNAGCCIVASNTGGVPEIIRDGYNGLLFTPGNSEELAAQLKRVIMDADLRRRLSDAARETGQPFDSNENLQRLLSVYARVMRRER